ncbi:MAG: hypothetical protein LBI62_06955 [Candidatus Accumulibacter sp.]|jgi:hypothetical protein|nr:hypothetical protein [Accumulibacter sp.]
MNHGKFSLRSKAFPKIRDSGFCLQGTSKNHEPLKTLKAQRKARKAEGIYGFFAFDCLCVSVSLWLAGFSWVFSGSLDHEILHFGLHPLFRAPRKPAGEYASFEFRVDTLPERSGLTPRKLLQRAYQRNPKTFSSIYCSDAS